MQDISNVIESYSIFSEHLLIKVLWQSLLKYWDCWSDLDKCTELYCNIVSIFTRIDCNYLRLCADWRSTFDLRLLLAKASQLYPLEILTCIMICNWRIFSLTLSCDTLITFNHHVKILYIFWVFIGSYFSCAQVINKLNFFVSNNLKSFYPDKEIQTTVLKLRPSYSASLSPSPSNLHLGCSFWKLSIMWNNIAIEASFTDLNILQILKSSYLDFCWISNVN